MRKYSRESLLELIDAEQLRIEAAKMKITAYEMFLEEIPAEPVVLSAEEIEEIARKQGPVDGIWNADHVQATVRNTIALCRKYFRLERDLELSPVLQDTEKLLEMFKQDTAKIDYLATASVACDVMSSIRNLKPLNQD